MNDLSHWDAVIDFTAEQAAALAVGKVSDLFCDKLTFTIDYKHPVERAWVSDRMKEFCSQKLQVKQHPGQRYKHRVFVYQGAYPSTMQMLIEYEPKASGLSYVRIDFNPAHCDMDAVKALLLSVLPGGLDDLPVRAKVTRIDLSVDLIGVHIDSLLLAFPGMQVSQVHCKSGLTETLYLGGYEGAKHVVVYDKVQEVKHLNATKHLKKQLPADPTTRIEIRLRPECGLAQLADMENQFKKLILSSWATAPKQDNLTWKLFIALAQCRGLHDALLMIDDKPLRKKYREQVAGASPHWWKGDSIWEGWPKVLTEVFMLNASTVTPA